MNTQVHWGAIFAGSLIGAATVVFFSLLSLALGIGGFNVILPIASSASWGEGLYMLLSGVVSFALAGYCTARLANLRAGGTACLHALTAFSLAGTFMPLVFSRALFVGGPGFAVLPPAAAIFSAGMAWSLCFTYALSAVACSGGALLASRRRARPFVEGYEEQLERRAA